MDWIQSSTSSRLKFIGETSCNTRTIANAPAKGQLRTEVIPTSEKVSIVRERLGGLNDIACASVIPYIANVDGRYANEWVQRSLISLGAYRYSLQTYRNWYIAVLANKRQLQKTRAVVHYWPKLSHKMLIELRKLSEGHRIVEPVLHVETKSWKQGDIPCQARTTAILWLLLHVSQHRPSYGWHRQVSIPTFENHCREPNSEWAPNS